MKAIGAAKLKEQCLALFDRLDPDGFVITKLGKLVARLVLFKGDHDGLIGSLYDKVKIRGDIISTGEVWNAGAES